MGDMQDELKIANIGSAISSVTAVANGVFSEGKTLVHGDFHWEKLLADEAGKVVVCDWQGVKWDVPSGDVSFFLSRLGADGVNLDPEVFLTAYAEARERRSGEKMDVDQLRKHMAAANVITTFRYWHFFLQGSGRC